MITWGNVGVNPSLQRLFFDWAHVVDLVQVLEELRFHQHATHNSEQVHETQRCEHWKRNECLYHIILY